MEVLLGLALHVVAHNCRSILLEYHISIISCSETILFSFISDINECESNPCHNGGICADNINSYVCTCLTGYTGTFCEIGISM